ncbi:hypothetical protein B9Z55_007922 [Caenorhabditis nigoni]|uniref:BTB domain-containing protein n=1 Tax=Caenorhabditis nigoni TaxID=1611254 RepID=A0A2G5VBX2_9PELO|nr:hypothetical protein B9Z55_007922 [Caenorhabditis nigoni]
MSVGEEKKFVMKHVFKNLPKFMGDHYGPKEEHFGLPWRIRFSKNNGYNYIHLDCLKLQKATPWNITASINTKVLKKNDDHLTKTDTISFRNGYESRDIVLFKSLGDHLIDGNITIELEIEISETSGMELPRVRKFDDDVAKEFSDIVLSTGSQEFYVNKMYLSQHSTYFKSLFSGNFSESEKSIIELKDIDPNNFQKFLEVLYGEAAITEDSVSGILKLADMYNSKTATERCEEFFIHISEKSLRDKFHVAVKYNLEELKKKCFSELKTAADYHSILPEASSQFGPELWEELFLKALTVQK